MGVAGDLLAVVEDARCTLDLLDEDLLGIATGLAGLMAEYDKMGVYSFNMNFFYRSQHRRPFPLSSALRHWFS